MTASAVIFCFYANIYLAPFKGIETHENVQKNFHCFLDIITCRMFLQ